MIIVRLQGGLGNQMFQYAFGKSLSLAYNTALFVDTSFLEAHAVSFEGFTARLYELEIFKANISIASRELIASFEKNSVRKSVMRRLKVPHRKCYYENESGIVDQLLKIKPPVLLIGHWQSEQYFKKHSNEIREAFTFKSERAFADLPLANQITQCNAVSIHIRRGDYVSNPLANQVLGVLDLRYYQTAQEIIRRDVDNPVFFVFSDDPTWVRSNIHYFDNAIVVDTSNEEHSHIDLYLMSQCKHNIIANSSFSWWGAWLNTNPSKIVITPKGWFKDTSLRSDALIPSNWLKV